MSAIANISFASGTAAYRTTGTTAATGTNSQTEGDRYGDLKPVKASDGLDWTSITGRINATPLKKIDTRYSTNTVSPDYKPQTYTDIYEKIAADFRTALQTNRTGLQPVKTTPVTPRFAYPYRTEQNAFDNAVNKLASNEAMQWGLGIDYASKGRGVFTAKDYRAVYDVYETGVTMETGAVVYTGGYDGLHEPLTTRSEKLTIQAKMEATEKSLNEQMSDLMKRHGIALGKNDRLDFTIDQNGMVKIKSGIADDAKKQKLENALNNDTGIRQNMFLLEAQKRYLNQSSHYTGSVNSFQDAADAEVVKENYEDGFCKGYGTRLSATTAKDFDVETANALVYNAYALANGLSIGKEGVRPTEFTIDFSYQAGKVFQGDAPPEDRLFSSRIDSLGTLAKIIGFDFDTESGVNVSSFVAALTADIDAGKTELQAQLNEAIEKAGLGSVKKKITFSMNEHGRVIVEGNLRKDQKLKLETVINGNAALAGKMKTQSAKQDVLTELQSALTDEPDLSSASSPAAMEEAVKKFYDKPVGFDLSSDKLAFAREQLLGDYMKRSGVSMTELQGDTDGVFARHGAMNEIAGLRNEVEHLFAEDSVTKTTEAKPLLAMKRGELAAVSEEEPDFTEQIRGLKRDINDLVTKYNEDFAQHDSGLRITGWTIMLDDTGRATIEVQTEDGDAKHAAQAKKIMNSRFDPASSEALGQAILDAHDDEHGDVLEYKHYVEISSGAADYKVFSPAADKAALAEIAAITGELGNTSDIAGKLLELLEAVGKLHGQK